MRDDKETIKTKIWFEEPMEDNPFAADACYCSGYDVYGDLLGKVSWVEYLYLLFKLELPTRQQAALLELIAVAIANPGIRDHSVRAAMNAGLGGSSRASSLIAAVAVGAGNLNGGREILHMVRLWSRLGSSLNDWYKSAVPPYISEQDDVWVDMEHVAGFDPNGACCQKIVLQTLEKCVACSPSGKLAWLHNNRTLLESAIGYPLALSGVIATALVELGFDEGQAEVIYIMLRLPGAAAHALEQEKHGWRQYPFFGSALKPMSEEDYKNLLGSLGD